MWTTLFSIFVATIASATTFILLYYAYAFTYWKRKGVPYVTPKFPFGNLEFQVSKYYSRAFATVYTEMKKAGAEYCGFYLLAMPVFMPLTPELNKIFLTKCFNNFNDRGFLCDEVNDPIGANLLTSSGEKWKKMRDKFSPTLTPSKTKMMMPLITFCAKELEEAVETIYEKGEPIDADDLAKRYTIDVICLCGFGVEGNTLKNPQSEFLRNAKKIFDTNLFNSFRLTAAQTAPWISRLFKMQMWDPEATEFFRKIVFDTIHYRETNNIERNDFLNMMILLKHNKSIEDDDDKTANESRQKKSSQDNMDSLTDNEIAAQCFLFFIAGFETTSSLLMYTLYHLAMNQDIQDRVREEVSFVLEKHNGEMSFEAIKNMQYLDNVLSETLRISPVVTMLNRSCTEDFKVPGSNVMITKGTLGIMSILGLHYDPEFYPNPEKFNPDRFTEEEKAKRPTYAYLPFGEGPRICPGIKFGNVEAKVGIATILKKYRVKIHPTFEVPVKYCSVGNVLAVDGHILLSVEHI